MRRVTVRTTKREELVDITDLVRGELSRDGGDAGSCVAYCPHTTAGLTINEGADPAVAADLRTALDRLVADDVAWSHVEGNSPAHVKASLVGSSVHVIVDGGELALGTWQRIFLCEFDGPRTRQVWLRFAA